jgi:hypothetical protein
MLCAKKKMAIAKKVLMDQVVEAWKVASKPKIIMNGVGIPLILSRT